MSDKWEQFKRRLDEVNPLKRKLRIAIYGSYYPPSELEFLKRQRDYLISNGYVNTNIVKDFHDQYPSLTPLQISRDCLHNSDVNFFIFTKEGKNQGVTVELQIAATEESMSHKVRYCVVFDQIRDDFGSISALSLDVIENAGIIRRDFVSEPDLQTALLQKAFLSLRRLQNELRRR